MYPQTTPINVTCRFCGDITTLNPDIEGFTKYLHCVPIQTAFPGLSADERERLLTGTCASCWDKHIGQEDN